MKEINDPIKNVRGIKKDFLWEEIKMAKKHQTSQKSSSLAVKEIWLKSSLRFHLTPVVMAENKKKIENK